MKTLLKNGSVVNVFTGEVTRADVLLDGERILGVGEYERADLVRDLTGCYLCPGLIDGHIHIESTMLLPDEFARAAVPHGTTAVVADPHEIANVCGASGILFLLEASESLPLTVYFTLPSCVPSTEFDEAGARLTAADLEPFYRHPRVLGLAEVMDYPAVIAERKRPTPNSISVESSASLNSTIKDCAMTITTVTPPLSSSPNRYLESTSCVLVTGIVSA